MLKDHPKGLFVLAFANMGERFGYYTMLAIFVLFIQAKFGFAPKTTSLIYVTFLALVYFLPLFGGLLADKVLGYGKTIILGVVVMFLGYLLLAVPSGTNVVAQLMMFGALALIAIGTGFFKGNLQALVGNLYDDPKYNSKRDLAYSIFYMCINIGAFFAPSAAKAIVNHSLARAGLTYDASIPVLAHQMMNNTITPEGTNQLATLASAQGYSGTDILEFGRNYIAHLSASYNYGFAVACVSLVISLLIFLVFRKYYKKADVTARELAKEEKASGEKSTVEPLSPAETKERIIALCLVFSVVIFFWMAFHQNGLTLTWFARDYTMSTVGGLNRFSFSLPNMVMLIVAFYGLVSFVTSKKLRSRLISAAAFFIGAIGAYILYHAMPETINITPESFQQFNPFFIVILTPLSVGLFAWLASKGKEPSAPRKIGFGMLIAAIGFIIMSLGSIGLPTPDALAATGGVDGTVSPNLLISTYFTLTIAELFLSPMGLSFVSRVAPPQYKGLMQGGWLAATAVGNYCVAIIGILWGGMQLWMLWGILVVCCLLAAAFIFSIMKRLEKVAK